MARFRRLYLSKFNTNNSECIHPDLLDRLRYQSCTLRNEAPLVRTVRTVRAFCRYYVLNSRHNRSHKKNSRTRAQLLFFFFIFPENLVQTILSLSDLDVNIVLGG